ncbi:PREDICTED: uncharacterized protein LOC107119263 [Gekko japonicus]|uniref:Uncharacterized protein LOC107119263 n=1 Tax=Gekko japonicus TaxID=146911 RepID=A0ABM1KU29_GEKJA|nr:PREDICTED: uncharacterized protein LOC107119263 [Gekko japonicus]
MIGSRKTGVRGVSWREKENILATVTEDRFDEELVTINHDDLRTSTLPTFAIPSSSRDSCAETYDSQDTRTEDFSQRASTGRGNSGLSVASDGDIEDHIDGCEQEEMSSHNTDGVTEHDRSSGSEQARKEEKRANEAQRVRRVALLNDVAMKMLEQGTAEHKEIMKFLGDWEERKFESMKHESQLDRHLLQETMQRNADVLAMAVDSIRHLTEVISGTQSIAGTKANPCTCSPTTGPRTTSPKGWCAAKQMRDNSDSEPVPEVLVQDTPEESQSILFNKPKSAESSGTGGRGEKRACVGRERVFFEP